MRFRQVLAAAVGLAAFATADAALAHTFGGAGGGGFGAGFGHPLGGLDHVLAMLGVGVWAAQTGGRAVWLVPASFVAMVALGGVAAVTGVALPMVELGIVGSVVVVGALIAFGARLPVVLGMGVVGALALFHGHAHGTGMPLAAAPALYGLGFVVATAMLHAAGIGLAVAVTRRLDFGFVRVGGAGMMAAGLVLLAGL